MLWQLPPRHSPCCNITLLLWSEEGAESFSFDYLQTLVRIPTLAVSRHLVAREAVTVVTLLSVHTAPVRTEVRVEGALVNTPGEVGGNVPTQQLVLRSLRRGTGLTEVWLSELPALAHGLTAAAVNLGQLEGDLCGAPAAGPREGGEAVTLPPVQAAQPVLGGDEAGLADTVVAGLCVDTAPVMTAVLPGLALVLVLALMPGVHHGAGRADTVEGSHRVLAFSAETQPGYRLTLVDVHTLPGVNVLQEARLTLQLGRAALTGVAPGLTYGGAAELTGADDALELIRALAISRPPVAGPRPVVNLTVATCEAVHTGTPVRSDTSPSVTALLLTDGLLAELPGVARPADTGVVATGPAVQTS